MIQPLTPKQAGRTLFIITGRSCADDDKTMVVEAETSEIAEEAFLNAIFEDAVTNDPDNDELSKDECYVYTSTPLAQAVEQKLVA